MSETPTQAGPFSEPGVLARFLDVVHQVVDKSPPAVWTDTKAIEVSSQLAEVLHARAMRHQHDLDHPNVAAGTSNPYRPVETIAYRPADAARVIGCSRSYIYELLSSGQLVGRKLGGRTLISRDALLRFVAGLPELRSGEQ